MRSWGPVRAMSMGGLAFGAVVLVVGILLLLVNQQIIRITFDLWTVCAIGLIILGLFIVGGTVWMRAMVRGRWRKWMDWEEPPQQQQ